MAHAWSITESSFGQRLFHGGIDFLTGLGTIFVVLFGGQMALAGEMSIADVAGFLLYIGSFYEPIMRLNHTNEGLQQALAAADRYFEILDIPRI